MAEGKPGFSLSNWRAYCFPRHDHLPHDLTSADWLKALAVILMICDHVGYYLFPDIEWFRVPVYFVDANTDVS